MSALFVQTDGGFRPATDNDILDESENAAVRQMPIGEQFADRKDVKRTLVAMLAGKKTESFLVAYLTVDRRLIKLEEMFKGTIDQVNTFPRDIIKRALELDAKNIIMIHNHPMSPGGSESSMADKMMTMKVGTAAALFDIDMLDHFVISSNGKVSSVLEEMAEQMRHTVRGSFKKLLSEALHGDDDGQEDAA